MSDIRKLISELAGNPDRLAVLDPHEFELIVAEILASQGYKVQVTPPTRDGGYDVLAVQADALGIESTYAVEVKRCSPKNKVGVDIVRRLLGVKEFLGVSIARSRPIDQFLISNPEYFFSSSPEHARINPDNLMILVDHVKCASFELPFEEQRGLFLYGKGQEYLDRNEKFGYYLEDEFSNNKLKICLP